VQSRHLIVLPKRRQSVELFGYGTTGRNEVIDDALVDVEITFVAALLRPPTLRPGAARAAHRRPARLSLPQAAPDGRTELRRSPLELIERLGALIPPPRLHRHR
jgi:hypothetical protein